MLIVAPKDMLFFIRFSYPPFPKSISNLSNFKPFKFGSASAPKGFRAMCYPLSTWGGFSTNPPWLHLSADFARPDQTEDRIVPGAAVLSWFFLSLRILVLEGAAWLGFLCFLWLHLWWVLFTPSLPKMHWRAGRTRCHLLCFCQLLLAAQTSVVPFSSFCWREGSLSSPFEVRVKWPWGSL